MPGSDRAKRILSWFVVVQIVLAIAAIGVSWFAAYKVAPLFRQTKELERELEAQKAELQKVKTQLSKEREALAAGREAINAFHAGDYEGALNAYNRALELDPQNAYLLNLKGYVLFKMKRFPEAIQALNGSIEANPRYVWAYFDLARVDCASGRLMEAQNAIKKAVDLGFPKARMADDLEFARVCRPLRQLFVQ